MALFMIGSGGWSSNSIANNINNKKIIISVNTVNLVSTRELSIVGVV